MAFILTADKAVVEAKIEWRLVMVDEALLDIKYPEIPLSIDDIYVVTVDGDRFDLLANRYYGDVSLYWIISAANSNLPQNSLFPPPGTQIRIPTDVSAILAAYDKLNN